jgi:hypothetical protein
MNPLLVLLDEVLKAGRGGRVAGGGDDLDRRRRGEESFSVAESETARSACAVAEKVVSTGSEDEECLRRKRRKGHDGKGGKEGKRTSNEVSRHF